MIKIINKDCIEVLKKVKPQTVDVVVTSPPYNLGIKYNTYKDRKSYQEYLDWLSTIFSLIKDVLKEDGSFFLNVGQSNIEPWICYDVANIARNLFVLQNDITWVKNISIDDMSVGHFKPINSKRFLNQTNEKIWHFTKNNDVCIDRLGIGVPYADKSNINRWAQTNGKDKRCRGNTWYVPYETINSKEMKGLHPAIFPTQLAEMCIKLHGIKKDMLVIDPFMGSGSVLVACQQLGINGIGIDIDKQYCDFVKQRIWQIPH